MRLFCIVACVIQLTALQSAFEGLQAFESLHVGVLQSGAFAYGSSTFVYGVSATDDVYTRENNSGLNAVLDTPAGASRIIGSPQSGPSPQHTGDRGGSLQLATLAVVIFALGFIVWRVSRSARSADATRSMNT